VVESVDCAINSGICAVDKMECFIPALSELSKISIRFLSVAVVDLNDIWAIEERSGANEANPIKESRLKGRVFECGICSIIVFSL